MNKDSIYRIIGYNGEYNASVKKAIRKLLKENHPDNKGNRKVFELINEVKNELENNKVSFTYDKNKNNINVNTDIDYLYCSKMIDKLTKEKNIYTKELREKKEELAKCITLYKDYYHDDMDLETYLLSNSSNKKILQNIKKNCIFLSVIAIILFFISIWKKSIFFFIFFAIVVVICVLIIQRAFIVIERIGEDNQQRLKSYFKVNSNIRDNQSKQDRLRQEINEINKKINNIENDLRFYKNISDNRG